MVAACAAAGLLAVAADGPLASAGFLAAVVALGVALRRAGPVPALATLLAAMVFQNLVAAAFARELGSAGVMAALAGKELFALAAAATGLVLLRGRLPGTLADRACALYVLAVAGLVAAAGLDGSVASAASVRQALTLPLLYVVGRSASLGAAGSSSLLGVVLRLGLVAASFGLLERFLLGDAFFVDLGLGVLFEKKGLGSWVFGELPGNFYSWDAGRPLRRLVGTIAEPTSMAHFLAVPVALLLGARSVLAGAARPRGSGSSPALALLLTLGKSGVATALLGAATGLARQGRWVRIAAALGLCPALPGSPAPWRSRRSCGRTWRTTPRGWSRSSSGASPSPAADSALRATSPWPCAATRCPTRSWPGSPSSPLSRRRAARWRWGHTCSSALRWRSRCSSRGRAELPPTSGACSPAWSWPRR